MNNINDAEQTITQRLSRTTGDLETVTPAVVSAFRVIYQTLHDNHTLYTCGNGGSHSDAQHIVGELMKAFELRRPIHPGVRHKLSPAGPKSVADRLTAPLRAIALGTNGALSTAVANDQGQDVVFAQELLGLGESGDVLLGLSTSGRSENVVRAFEIASALGLRTVALTGREPSPLSQMADVTVQVPATGSAPVQEIHIRVYHTLCAALEIAFFSE